MTRLYEIASDYARLSDSDMSAEMIADTLDCIAGEMEVKIENCIAIIKNEVALAEALKAEASNLNERAKFALSRAESLKRYIAESLYLTGMKTIRAGIHQVSTREPVQTVEITNIDDIPADFITWETNPKPLKLEIKKQLEAGVSVPGATLKAGKMSVLIK